MQIPASVTSDDVAMRAQELFNKGWYCAEAVLLAVAEAVDVRGDHIPGIVTGTCSGVANTDGPCGAFTGAVAAIGLVFGRTSPTANGKPCYSRVQSLHERFVADYGHISCEQLLGFPTNTEAGRDAAARADAYANCGHYTARAAALAWDEICKEG